MSGRLSIRRRWTPRQLEILRREYPTRTAAAVARKVGHSVGSVYRAANRLGLRKTAAFLASPASGRLYKGDTRGVSGRFGPGHATWNKGRKGWKAGGRSAQTRFKPGNRPHTWVPVGTLRINCDGYLDRKVTDDGRGPRDWVAVHRLVWEAEHGPVPPGHVVVFKPGRRSADLLAITLDAVELVTRQELMSRNTLHNYPKPIARLIQLRGALMRQINKRERDAK